LAFLFSEKADYSFVSASNKQVDQKRLNSKNIKTHFLTKISNQKNEDIMNENTIADGGNKRLIAHHFEWRICSNFIIMFFFPFVVSHWNLEEWRNQRVLQRSRNISCTNKLTHKSYLFYSFALLSLKCIFSTFSQIICS